MEKLLEITLSLEELILIQRSLKDSAPEHQRRIIRNNGVHDVAVLEVLTKRLEKIIQSNNE